MREYQVIFRVSAHRGALETTHERRVNASSPEEAYEKALLSIRRWYQHELVGLVLIKYKDGKKWCITKLG